ncbi:hypothetical protein EV401DRAFT_1808945, partial [Pisolithus croceorrhizus]
EVFKLMFRFDVDHPISALAVQFVIDQTTEGPIVRFVNVPNWASIHGALMLQVRHIYSNGHVSVCQRTDVGSPVLSLSAVCVTLQSMLASCKVRGTPPMDNDRYVRTAPDNPKR